MGEKLQSFVESTAGQAIIVGCIILIMVLILVIGGKREKKVDVKALTLSALLIALAMILSQIKLFSMPQGGSITLLSMLPIALCAYLLGTYRGVMAGIALGLVNLIFGPYVIHPLQMLLDYPIAFGAMGIGGFLRNRKNGLIKGYLAGLLGRYVCAVISGIVFFGSYAPPKFNAVTWSLWYNLTYIAVEGAITVAILCIPSVRHAFERLKESL